MEKPRVLILTGVGVSAESGIHIFRTADGLQEEHRVKDVATLEGFDRDPELVQTFYSIRCRQLQQSEIRPSAARLALAELQDALGGRFLLMTQSTDNLHERAGSTNMTHMHGGLLKVRCSQSGQVLDWTGDVTPEDKYHCCQFPAPLCPHVVWFGEMPLGIDEIYMALSVADILIAIGTSRHAYSAAGFAYKAKLRDTHAVELNLEPGQIGNEFAEKYYGPVSQVMSEFVEKLLKGLKAGSIA